MGNPNAKPQGVSVETFVMTHSELFLQLMEQTTRLVTHDLDGSLDFAKHDQFCTFFLTSYSSLLHPNSFRITSSMIIAFSTFATFCGYQYSYSELLQYQPKFQKADLTLQHMFIQQIPLVGKVFGSIFELDNTKIIADAHNNTHEYLVRRVLVSLTACIALSTFSRLYIYNNIPSSARCLSTDPSPTVTRPRPSTNMQQRCSPSRSALLRHPVRQLAAAHLSLHNHRPAQQHVAARTCPEQLLRNI